MKYPSAKSLILLLIPILWRSACSAPTEDCFETMSLKYCSMDENDETNRLWGIQYGLNIFFVIDMEQQCIGRGFTYQWLFKRKGTETVLHAFKEFSTRSILVIPYSMHPAGDMLLDVTVSKPGTKEKKKFTCMVWMFPGWVQAGIRGADVKTVHNGDTVQLDGTTSYEAGYTAVDYTWTCKCKDNIACNEFRATGKTTEIKVTGRLSDDLRVELTLSADGSSDVFEHSLQIADDSYPNLDVVCRQNCVEAGHFDYKKEFTINMEVKCKKTCEKIAYYVWEGPGIGHGAKNHLFTGHPGSNKNEDQYVMISVIVSALDEADQTLSWAQWTSFPQHGADEMVCNIYPTEGTAIITLFEVNCTRDQSGVPLAVTIGLDVNVRLAADDGAVWVELAKDRWFLDKELETGVTVGPLFAGKSSSELIDELTKILNDESQHCRSPTVLAKDGRVWEAMQIISAVLTELKLAKHTDEIMQFSYEFTIDIMVILLEFPLDSQPNGLIEIIMKLFLADTVAKNVETNLKLSEYCKTMARNRRAQLTHEPFPLMQEFIIRKQEVVFQQCASYLFESKYQGPGNSSEKVKPNKKVDHPSVPEDYPSYKDVMSEETQGEMRDITENALAVVALSNIIRFYAQAKKSYPIRNDSYLMETFDSKDIDREIKLAQCRIYLPKNLGLKDHELTRLTIFMTTKLAFHWDKKVYKDMCTNLINLRLLNSSMDIVQLPEPLHIYIEAKANDTFFPGNASLPAGVPAFNNTNFPVYRIDVVKDSNVIIQFRNISSPHGLKVFIKKGKRPSLKDFANATIIKSTGLIQIHKVSYDTWFYMAILPATAPIIIHGKPKRAALITYETDEKTDPSITGVTFEYRLITQRCAEWINGTWKTDSCVLGKDSVPDMIHCTCRSLVNFAGFSNVPDHKLDEVTSIDLVLKFRWNFMIYIMLFFVVLCYLVALCFEVLRKPPYQYIYYLSDNKRTHAYAYLIKVKTKDIKEAGTTSNATIRLVGDYCASKPHVLNYPDPDKNLLQTSNEDFFILATRRHLGHLKGIELWIDSLSSRPQWACKYIKICDLQTHHWSLFYVNTLFSPLEGKYYYVSVRAGKKEEKTKIWTVLHDIFLCFRLRYGADHTWNIHSRDGDHDLFYTERIAIILSHILTTYSLALFICAAPEFKNSDVLDQGFVFSYLYTLRNALIISMISSLFNYLFALFYRCTTRTHHQPYAVRKKFFRPKVKYAISTILILTLIANILYLAFFSIGISYHASYIWLAVTAISLFFTIFLWENIYAGIFAVVHMYTATRMVYHYDSIIRESKRQRAHLRLTLPKPYNLRPYLQHLYEPMSYERHIRKREQLKLTLKLAKTFKDMIAFLLYFCLLYILAGVNTDSHGIYLQRHFVDMFKGLVGRNHPTIHDVTDLQSLYRYLNETVVETLHGRRWYGDYAVVDPGLMADFQTKFLGVARIRQKMVRFVPCPEREFTKTVFNITKCVPEYSYEDRFEEDLSKYSSIFTYRKDKVTNLHIGEMAAYTGGGYTTHLGRTLENAYYNVDEIISKKWLYRTTRALFIEFWAYNANRNVFAIVCIAIERSATGFMWHDIHVVPYSLMFAHISDEMLTLVVFAIFTVIMVYNLIGQIQQLVQYKWAYFAQFWMDILVYIANLTVIGFFIRKELLVDDLLKLVDRSKKSEFIPYFDAINFCGALTILIGVLICIAVMKTWTFCRFGFIFRVFERTIKTQLGPLIGAAIFNVAIFMMFIVMAFLLFSPHASSYRDPYNAITYMSLFGFGQKIKYDHTYMRQYNPVFAEIFYVLFNFAMLLMVNFYITIITINYEESREFVSNQQKEYSVADYVKDEYRYHLKYFKRRRKYLTAGEGYTETAAAGEFLKIPSNRFEAMSAITYAVIYNRNIRRPGRLARQPEFDVMNTVVGWYFAKDGGEPIPYYHDVLPSGKVHFLTTKDMTTMETIADTMLDIKRVEEEPEIETKVMPGIMKDTITLKRIIAIERILQGLAHILSNIEVVDVYDQKKK